MGLLLSVLVACVGVVELFAFYSNVSRNFVTTSNRTHLSHLTQKYLEGLEQHRKTLQNRIDSDINIDEHIKTDSAENNASECHVEETKLKSLLSNGISLKGSEIIARSRSPSPLQPVATINGHKSFPNDVTKDQIKNRNEISCNNSIGKRNATEFTFALQEQFIVTEQKHAVETSTKSHSRSRSPLSNLRTEEEEVAFRRSPSPYPSLVLSVSRNSVCNELLDNATVSVAEVDEETISRSPTPEKIHVILESKHNTTEYWTNKVLVVPPSKSHSNTSVENKKSQNSDSLRPVQLEQDISFVETSVTETKEPNEKITLERILSRDSEISLEDDEEIENEIKEYDEQFLDSIDGVKKKKLSRSSSSRRSRKKKTPNLSIDNEPKDDSLSSPSVQNNDAHTAKTLTDAANVLKNVNQEAGGPSTSSAGSSKDSKTAEPEPFWVNRRVQFL